MSESAGEMMTEVVRLIAVPVTSGGATMSAPHAGGNERLIAPEGHGVVLGVAVVVHREGRKR